MESGNTKIISSDTFAMIALSLSMDTYCIFSLFLDRFETSITRYCRREQNSENNGSQRRMVPLFAKARQLERATNSRHVERSVQT